MRGFSANDNPSHKGKSNTWFTPGKIISSLCDFDLDPCTQSFRPHKLAKKEIFHDLGHDGLEEKWEGKVWLNPPYGSHVKKWLDKLYEHGDGIALVFSRTDTKWAQEHLSKCDGVNFLKGRVSFIHESGKHSHNASNGSMLLAYGEHNIKYLFNINGIVMDSFFIKGKYAKTKTTL